jgi:TetR/AcrR family transcriptional repressor of nem operon
MERVVMKKPVQKVAKDTKQTILLRAQDIILGKGFTATGINEILTAASVPKGSFYHHFKSKEHFGAALVENYFEHYLIGLEGTLTATDPERWIDRFLDYFKNWQLTQCKDTTKDKCLVVKLSGEVSDLSEAMRTELDRGTQKVITRLAQCIASAQTQNEIQVSDSAEQLAHEIYYLWIGASLISKVSHSSKPFDIAYHVIIERFKLEN